MLSVEILKGYPNIFFTSDLHFDHQFMVKGKVDENGVLLPGATIPRPMFSTVDEMNETIIARNNERVRPGDLVYDLGDFAVKTTEERAMAYRKRLIGQRYQFEGNHDQIATKLAKKGAFIWYRQLEELSLGSPYFEGDKRQLIVLCHYAMKVWHNSFRGAFMLYGHSHGMLPEDHTLSFDVGVDVWDFYPVSIEEVKAKMVRKLPAWLEYQETLKGLGRVE